MVTSFSVLENNLSFTFDFQRHKQEVTQVKLASLVLENKPNKFYVYD